MLIRRLKNFDMLERDITAKVLQTAKQNLLRSAAIEIKLCKGESLPFSVLAEHQKQALLHAKHQRLVFKIPDLGLQNPFDAFLLAGTEAWVAVVFYKERLYKTLFLIDIDAWVKESEGQRKSLTKDGAQWISSFEFQI